MYIIDKDSGVRIRANHVWIIPVTGAGVGYDVVLVVAVVVNDALQAGPRVLDVVKVTPQVAVLND